ncbi:hypothetical protein BKA61DRAFT_23029 [Leptodontidium sp. MPI-SDFR-AT-0119]|nr:hypothetical protein BKA61DRAFT_23029 [Leptodontidium sp. MPI-SDFR-AT-0119]
MLVLSFVAVGLWVSLCQEFIYFRSAFSLSEGICWLWETGLVATEQVQRGYPDMAMTYDLIISFSRWFGGLGLTARFKLYM